MSPAKLLRALALGTALLVAIPRSAGAQAEVQAWADPTLGKLTPRTDYRLTYYPAERVEGQHSFSLSVPLSQDARNEWSLSADVRLEDLDTRAILPDTRERLPGELWDARVGATCRHRFENDWIGGANLTLGSASDKAFASEDELIVRAIGMLRVPHGDRNAWIFSLIYANDQEFLGGVPIPGIAYRYEPSDRFKAVIGSPSRRSRSGRSTRSRWRRSTSRSGEFALAPPTSFSGRSRFPAGSLGCRLVQKRREPHRLVPRRNFTYPAQRTGHARPALRPERGLLARVPFGQAPPRRFNPAHKEHRMTDTMYSIGGYPRVYRTRDGKAIAMRPMLPSDKDALLDFFRRIPPADRRYLRGDVTSPDIVAEWAQTLDYRRVLPLLAIVDGKIIGDGTLHRSEDAPRRHIGEVRIVVDPEYRNQGVGCNLLQQLIDIAKAEDPELEQILFEVVSDTQKAAQRAAKALGFVETPVFAAHERWYGGEPHDLILMALPVREPRADSDVDDPASHMF